MQSKVRFAYSESILIYLQALDLILEHENKRRKASWKKDYGNFTVTVSVTELVH